MPPAIQEAWRVLEEIVGDLRGRRFVGAFDARRGRYRACVEVDATASAHRQLSRGELPGGRYARIRLKGEPPGLYEQLPGAFEQLVADCPADAERPSLELYRRHDEVDALLPVSGR